MISLSLVIQIMSNVFPRSISASQSNLNPNLYFQGFAREVNL